MNWQKIKKEKLFIPEGEHLSFKSGEFRIRCGKGIVWATWPWSGDVILRENDEVYIRSGGTLCMKAFTGSVIYIKNGKLSLRMKNIAGLIMRKTYTAIKSNVKNRRNDSALRDSAHSLMR